MALESSFATYQDKVICSLTLFMSLFLRSMSCSMTVAGSKIVFCRSEVLAMCCDYALEAFAGDLQREFQLLGVSALQTMSHCHRHHRTSQSLASWIQKPFLSPRRGFLEPRQGDVSCEARLNRVGIHMVSLNDQRNLKDWEANMMQLCFNIGCYTVTEQPRSSSLFQSAAILAFCLDSNK